MNSILRTTTRLPSLDLTQVQRIFPSQPNLARLSHNCCPDVHHFWSKSLWLMCSQLRMEVFAIGLGHFDCVFDAVDAALYSRLDCTILLLGARGFACQPTAATRERPYVRLSSNRNPVAPRRDPLRGSMCLRLGSPFKSTNIVRNTSTPGIVVGTPSL